MKVAQFIHTDNLGGPEKLVVNIAEWLNNSGIDNVVVLVGNPWIEAQCEKRGISFIKLPSNIMKFWSIGFLPQFGYAFGKFLKDDLGITVLHSHLFGPTLRGAAAAYIYKIKHIATQHDVYTIQDKPRKHLWLAAAAFSKTKLVAVSEDMERYYRSFILLNRFGIETIYNGVDPNQFVPKLSANGDHTKFVYFGRLEKIKGVHRLLEIFNGLNEELPFGISASLHIYGSGSEEYYLRELSDDLGLEDVVTFHGHSDDIPKVLSEHDVFVMTSYSEGLSCSIMEAMHSGLPIVATNVGGNRELIIDNENGFLLDFNDEPDILDYSLDEARDCLKTLACSPKMRYNFGMKSLSLSRYKFSLSIMMDRYVNLYKE